MASEKLFGNLRSTLEMKRSEFAVGVLKRLPKNAISRAFGAISEVEFPPPLQKLVTRGFVQFAGIDAEEAARSLEDYDSLNDFFTRRLRAGARTVESKDPQVAVSPVDGTVGAFGAVDEGTLFQAKGRKYELLDLLDSAEEALRFDGGHYATIYLSPRDYHRIHSPVRGRIDKISYIPGHLFPVNPFAVSQIDELFAVNERLITYLDTTDLGRIAVIKVGATCVGRIGLSFSSMETNQRFRRREDFEVRDAVELSHGDELAVFNLGSTVIILVEEQAFRFADHVETSKSIQMGELLGRI